MNDKEYEKSLSDNDSNSNKKIPIILYCIAYIIGIFSLGILGLIDYGTGIIGDISIWFPFIFFIIGLIIAIYTRIKYKNFKKGNILLILYIVFGILVNFVLYSLIHDINEIINAIIPL